ATEPREASGSTPGTVTGAAGEGGGAGPGRAKLNLCLRIVGGGAEGNHRRQSVFRWLEGGDTIHLRPRDDGRIVRHGPSAAGVAEADDLAVRAAHLLKKIGRASCRERV